MLHQEETLQSSFTLKSFEETHFEKKNDFTICARTNANLSNR